MVWVTMEMRIIKIPLSESERRARQEKKFLHFFSSTFFHFFLQEEKTYPRRAGGWCVESGRPRTKFFSLLLFFFLFPCRGFSRNNNTKRSGEEAAEKTHWVNITSQINLSRGKIFSFPHHYTREKKQSQFHWLPGCRCVVCLCSVMLAPAPPFRLFWAPTKQH